ncbi:unnamed protein product [Pylaiella littoralis]
MRVSYRRQHPGVDGDVPDFLRSDFVFGAWERTGFDIDFPSIAEDPVVAAAVGYTGNNFLAESVGITRWYNRTTNVIAGSVIFSSSCEGPPGIVHGGAVSAALDDILGTMVWREAGFSRWGIPTMQLTIRFRGATPMERQLRFDTRVVKRDGRKVFVEAALRDPASGNKLLAEGEGLFYIKRPPESPLPPSPPARSLHSFSTLTGTTAAGSPAAAPDGDPKVEAQGARRPSSAESEGRSRLPPVTTVSSSTPGASAGGSRGEVIRRPRLSPPPLSSKPTAAPTSKPTTVFTGILSYDEAILQFGPENPDAKANIVAFYGGDVTALQRQGRKAKL